MMQARDFSLRVNLDFGGYLDQVSLTGFRVMIRGCLKLVVQERNRKFGLLRTYTLASTLFWPQDMLIPYLALLGTG
jgi:hypothetical protein